MKLFKQWFKEQKDNLGLMWKLNLYDFKTKYSRHYLGPLWIVLVPLLSIFVLWLVFGLGIRGVREDVQGIPFLVHLMTGFFPFGFISGCLVGGTAAIMNKSGLMTKMKFPASVLISIQMIGNFITLCVITVLVLIVSVYNNYTPYITYLGFFYFVIATVAFTYGLALILSAAVMVIRDVKNILNAVMRLFFFLTPIIWSLEGATPLMQVISAYNPFTFLVMTYRYSFVYEDLYVYGGATHHIYFWTLTILIFYVGLQVHYRFRDRFVDYMR